MSNNKYDVIVVGAGFAGLTAARELSKKHYSVKILEGRDRMGGRTWYDKRLGRHLEMGGTYVHWFQPHIWAEITRYNLEVEKILRRDEAYWIADGKLNVGTQDEMNNKIHEGMAKFLRDTFKYFPRPYEPFYEEDLVYSVDHISLMDQIRNIAPEVHNDVYDLVRAIWSTYANSDDLDSVALTQGYRWGALSNNYWPMVEEIFEYYKLKNGTKALIESIYNDSDAELQLSTPVTKVEKMTEGYKVTTREGEEFLADSVVTAIPINVINNIEFKPNLLPEKHQISTETQSSIGGKVWARVRGLNGTTASMYAPPEYPITSAHTDSINGDEGYIMGYVSNAKKIDVNDREEVQNMLRNWMPNIEVIEATGHVWVNDEFSQGTWPLLRKNQMKKYGRKIREREGGLFLASSDYADGWSGFMDGAIESGMKTSKSVDQYLQKVRLNFH